MTIDPDTEILLREEVRRSGRSFKRVLNDAVRGAFSQGGKQIQKVEPLFSHPFPREFEGRSFNQLADEWEDETTIQELRS